MRINISFRKSYAVALDEERMRQLLSILDKYYSDPSGDTSIPTISATLKNKASMRFDDVGELFAYNNSGSFRIEKLEIEYGSYRGCTITFEHETSFLFSYGSTIEASYYTQDKESFLDLRDKLERLFREMRTSIGYLIVSKISAYVLLLVSFAIYIMYLYVNNRLKWNPDAQINYAFPVLFAMCFLLVHYLFRRFWTSIFPPLQFLWGNEVKRLERLARFREKILWGVIIGAVISFAIGIVVSRVT